MAILLCLVALHCAFAIADQPKGKSISAEDREFFEKKIRPVLVEHCYECHSADSDELGSNLRLDHREGVLTGGESGPVVAPGRPDESLLIKALRYKGPEMPPTDPLSERVVNDFVEWVTRGAPDPRSNEKPPAPKVEPAPAGPTLWSLLPRGKPAVPAVSDTQWSADPLDRFVLSRIEAAGSKPGPDATPRALVRRLYYDLIGLPPTVEDASRFEDAFERVGERAIEELVDELIERPQFGERWARHWLDVARYGESNGNDGLSRNPTFPHAWRYRDYVISAFNADMPYDRFLTEQIAGDLLPSDSPEQRDRQLVATGFLSMAAKPAKAMNNNFDMDVVADQIDVVGTGVMGLSVGCARCHDHKFDPIPTSDYYALAGIFTSTETMWGVAANEKLTAPVTDLHVLKTAPNVVPPADFVETVFVLESNTGKPKAIPKPKWPVGTPLAMGVRDKKKPADCKVNINGDAKKLGGDVSRGFLTAFQLPNVESIDPTQSGRLELASWLTNLDHPLTARVMTNRVWQHLFGKGLVHTPDDFGEYGARPTHPELLDHLANRFVDDGWSSKRLIRSIVLSRTYRLASGAEGESDDLLTTHRRRRLDAESLRDSILSVSGQLDTRPGEGSIIRHRDILVNLAGSLHQPSRHRSVYLCYLRSSPPPSLAAFDLPSFTSVNGARDESTVPSQSLFLYNSPFVIEQSRHFAAIVLDNQSDTSSRIRAAYRRALLRDPTQEEQALADGLVELAVGQLESEGQAWATLCQALVATLEFRYVD